LWSLPFPRNLSFSGLSILGLSVFLFGFHWPEKPRLSFLAGLIVVGMLLLLVGQGDHLFVDLTWEWDIYEFLFVSLLLLYFLSSKIKLTYVLGALGLIMTLIPIWQWSDQWVMPTVVRDIFFGTCDGSGRGGWALFPNLGFVTFHFAVGRFFRNESTQFNLSEIKFKEWIVWIVLLLLSLPQLDAYFDTDIGPGFYCYIFRKPPLIFWSHYLWILFLIRLSVTTKVNELLGSFAIARWLSNLEWSRSFGLCYFLQLLIVLLVANGSDSIAQNHWQFDAFYLLVMPIVELLMRLIRFGQKFIKPLA